MMDERARFLDALSGYDEGDLGDILHAMRNPEEETQAALVQQIANEARALKAAGKKWPEIILALTKKYGADAAVLIAEIVRKIKGGEPLPEAPAKKPKEEPKGTPATNWALYGVAAAGVIGAGVLVWALLKKK